MFRRPLVINESVGRESEHSLPCGWSQVAASLLETWPSLSEGRRGLKASAESSGLRTGLFLSAKPGKATRSFARCHFACVILCRAWCVFLSVWHVGKPGRRTRTTVTRSAAFYNAISVVRRAACCIAVLVICYISVYLCCFFSPNIVYTS